MNWGGCKNILQQTTKLLLQLFSFVLGNLLTTHNYLYRDNIDRKLWNIHFLLMNSEKQQIYLSNDLCMKSNFYFLISFYVILFLCSCSNLFPLLMSCMMHQFILYLQCYSSTNSFHPR